MSQNPYALNKPCANCPFLKEGAIELAPGRVEGILQELITGESSGFTCHKTVYAKTGGHWEDTDDGERYVRSGRECECVGALVALEKAGYQTQLMQVMQRLGWYEPEKYRDCHDQVIDIDLANFKKPPRTRLK